MLRTFLDAQQRGRKGTNGVLWEEVKRSTMCGASIKASLGNFLSLQGSLFLPGKVRVETQLCTARDLCAESRQWQVCVQWDNVVYNMHEQMSALSEIIPSYAPSECSTSIDNLCVWGGPFIQRGCFLTSTWRLLWYQDDQSFLLESLGCPFFGEVWLHTVVLLHPCCLSGCRLWQGRVNAGA